MTPQQFYSKWAVSYEQIALICSRSDSTVRGWFRNGRNQRYPTHNDLRHLALLDFLLEHFEEIPEHLVQHLCLDNSERCRHHDDPCTNPRQNWNCLHPKKGHPKLNFGKIKPHTQRAKNFNNFSCNGERYGSNCLLKVERDRIHSNVFIFNINATEKLKLCMKAQSSSKYY